MKYNAAIDDYEPEGPWDEPPRCPVCGDDMERELCDHCDGTGEVDRYEDDAINYAPGQEYESCSHCDGEGGWWLCPQRGDDRHAIAAPTPTLTPPARQCRLCKYVFRDDSEIARHTTLRGAAVLTCADVVACTQRRTEELLREPVIAPWPWWVTIKLRAGWELSATLDATGEADALAQAETVARELLRVDVARPDQRGRCAVLRRRKGRA